jgi:hypothetical protein
MLRQAAWVWRRVCEGESDLSNPCRTLQISLIMSRGRRGVSAEYGCKSGEKRWGIGVKTGM